MLVALAKEFLPLWICDDSMFSPSLCITLTGSVLVFNPIII